MNVCDLFANVTATKAAFEWSCNFTSANVTAPQDMEFRRKATHFESITIKDHIIWWDDWSFVETLAKFAQQEYASLKRKASNEFGSDHVAALLSKLRCLTTDGQKPWSWGEIAL